jgi:hypothetical protein
MRRQSHIANFFREDEDAKTDWVCLECVGDANLKQRGATLFVDRICMGCGKSTSIALEPEKIAHIIRNRLPSFVEIDNTLHKSTSTLEEVVSRALRCNHEAICKAVASFLVDPNAKEEDFYWPGQEYCAIPSPHDSAEEEREWVIDAWNHIAHQLTHRQRFFNDKVRDFFEELFAEALDAHVDENPDVRPVIRIVPGGTDLFRARVAGSEAKVKVYLDNSELELGAPPKERAANNRMSPAGIPLLYVAGDPETAIAEVRPSIGDAVVVGRFSTTRNMKFFDFTALSGRLSHSPLSWLDPNYDERSRRRRLLEYLHDQIAKPVTSGDIDYVVTQALAEFIRCKTTENFDGVIFKSVQRSGGTNYVLFDRVSTLNEMLASGWRAKFDMKISTSDVTVYKVRAVYESVEILI